MLPIPFQMVVAALGARLARCNLALSVGLVWVTNPLTMPLIFYINYRIGTFLLGAPVREAPSRISTRWIAEQMHDILPPPAGFPDQCHRAGHHLQRRDSAHLALARLP